MWQNKINANKYNILDLEDFATDMIALKLHK